MKSSVVATVLVGVLAVSGPATQALGQETHFNQVAERALNGRAIEAVIWGMPAVNAQIMFDAAKQASADFNQIVYWSRPLTWKNQTLTPNPNTIYVFPIFNTKDVGPMVLEIPPADSENSITGSVDDGWQTAIEDVGPAGVDKGNGGKYLILPPGYNEKVPNGYIPLPSSTFSGFALLRSNLKSDSDADIAKAVAYGKRIKFYPLSQARNTPQTKFVDAIDVIFDSTIPYDLHFLEALDRFVQREPWLDRDRVMIDFLKTIGIEKGKPFNPDEKTKQVLNEAVREAHARLAYKYENVFTPPYYEGTHWGLPASKEVLEGVMTNYANPNAYPVDGRGVTYSYAFFSPKHLGDGAVLPDGYREQGRQTIGRRSHVSPERAGEPAGAAVLVGDGVRPCDAFVYPRDAEVGLLVPHAGPDKERRRVDGHLLRPKGTEGEGSKLGAHEERWRGSKCCSGSTAPKSRCSIRRGSSAISRRRTDRSGDVRYWHLADISLCTAHVCFRR